MKEQAIYSNLPVYRDCYAVMLEFAKIRGQLPRDTRYTIAQDLGKVLVAMMVTIYRANSSRPDKARLIAELRRMAVETQIYFRLLSDRHQLGAQKAAFFMDKVSSIGRQLAAWHKSSMRDDSNPYGAKPPPIAGGRPECDGLRPVAASHKANPISGAEAVCSAPAAKGDLTGNTETSP